MDAIKLGLCDTVQKAVMAAIERDKKRVSNSNSIAVQDVSAAQTRIRLVTDAGVRYFIVQVREEM